MRCWLCFLLITAAGFGQNLPTAMKQPVTDEYHGVKVVDDYRWLEDGTSAATRQWLAAENADSVHYFQNAPAWSLVSHDIRNPKEKQGAEEHSLDFRNGRFFYLQLDRRVQQQAVLMTSTSLGTSRSAPANARVLLDPGKLDPTGHTSIDWQRAIARWQPDRSRDSGRRQ